MSAVSLATWGAFHRYVLILALTAFASSTLGQTSQLRLDCLGDFVLGLPFPVEVAMPSRPPLGADRSVHFANGDRAPFSAEALALRGAALVVTNPTLAEEFDRYLEAVDRGYRESVAEMAKTDPRIAELTRRESLRPLSAIAWGGIGLDDKRWLRAYARVGTRTMVLDADDRRSAEYILDRFRVREISDVPTEPGVCAAAGFVAGSEHKVSVAAATMRPIEHPEVEILFEQRLAHPLPVANAADRDARAENEFFWMGDYRGQAKEIRLIGRGFHAVKLAGRAGMATYVEITRQDGKLDYGYHAFVKGDRSGKTDAPNLRLYVIRTASRAKGEPISREALFKLADEIAASVKRRDISR